LKREYKDCVNVISDTNDNRRKRPGRFRQLPTVFREAMPAPIGGNPQRGKKFAGYGERVRNSLRMRRSEGRL
jgi:hypothetical protein